MTELASRASRPGAQVVPASPRHVAESADVGRMGAGRQAAEMTWAHALDDIAAKTGISDHHPDVREGTTAFRERREPRFNEWLEGKR